MFTRLKNLFYSDQNIEENFFDIQEIDRIEGIQDDFLDELEERYAYLIDDPIKVWKFEDTPKVFLEIIDKHVKYSNNLKPTWISFVPNSLERFDSFIGIYKKIDIKDGCIYLLK